MGRRGDKCDGNIHPVCFKLSVKKKKKKKTRRDDRVRLVPIAKSATAAGPAATSWVPIEPCSSSLSYYPPCSRSPFLGQSEAYREMRSWGGGGVFIFSMCVAPTATVLPAEEEVGTTHKNGKVRTRRMLRGTNYIINARNILIVLMKYSRRTRFVPKINFSPDNLAD